jgi:hypothetical protein
VKAACKPSQLRMTRSLVSVTDNLLISIPIVCAELCFSTKEESCKYVD